MGRFRLSALVGAAISALPLASGVAADYPEAPAYLPLPVEIGKSWYLRGHIGMAAQHLKSLDHALFETATDFVWLDQGNFAAVPIFGLGVGFRSSEHLRFDVTGEYRGKSDFSALDQFDDGGTTTTDAYDGKASEWLFLANAYYDVGTWHSLTPYVGAGVGVSRNSIYSFTDDSSAADGDGWAPTGHQWSLAWALHAGTSMQVTDNLTIDLGYSFVSLGDAKTGLFQNVDPDIGCNVTDSCTAMTFRGLYSHDLKLALRWSIDHGATSNHPPMAKY